MISRLNHNEVTHIAGGFCYYWSTLPDKPFKLDCGVSSYSGVWKHCGLSAVTVKLECDTTTSMRTSVVIDDDAIEFCHKPSSGQISSNGFADGRYCCGEEIMAVI